MPTEHEVVALTADRPEDGLRVGRRRGPLSTATADQDVYEIEFIDEHGRTKCVATVPSAQIMKLNLLSLSA